MGKINNCSNCEYKDYIDGEMVCNRPLEVEGRLANVGKAELVCPCHSEMDRMKRQRMYIDDGLFRVTPEELKKLEKIIFG